MSSKNGVPAADGNARGAGARRSVAVGYRSRWGTMYHCTVEEFLASRSASHYRGKVQLIFTSPPFPLNRAKAYGNEPADKFSGWLAAFAPHLVELLTPSGSIVMEMGNAWEPGRPVMSVLSLECLLAFLKGGKLSLAQQFVCYNPARLPSPAQWVNVERIRLKDSYTNVWWMSKTDHPYADNRNVLKPYSQSMLKLLQRGTYNHGKRPSEHHIGETSFLTDNHGAIPSNVLTISNTRNDDAYQKFCRANGLKPHPARMPSALPDFFIRFLTKEDDLVMDPFGGSNTTGAVAQALRRRWISIEPQEQYVRTSKSRFWYSEGVG